MADIHIDTWLYGTLARFGGNPNEHVFSNSQIALKEHSSISDLLTALGMKTDERGITFINGELSAMPGLQPDLDHLLKDGDRVAFFHLQSMWPFQYRNGIVMIDEMQTAMNASTDGGLRHAYEEPRKDEAKGQPG